MKVILAGSTGTIGRPLLKALRDNGHESIAIIRNPANRGLVENLGAVAVVADVMDRNALLTALDGRTADAVMHQATALRGASPRLRQDDPTNALRTKGTEHLLEAATSVGASRFVVQSLVTGYGYHNHGTRPLTEDDPFGALRGHYADPVVSAAAEAERLAFSASGVDGIALRYGMFYGPRAFSDLFADLMRKRTPVAPRGGGGEAAFVHIEDAASAAIAALEHGRPGNAYNIADGNPTTWGEFASAVARAHGTPRPVTAPRWLLRLVGPYLEALMAQTSMRIDNIKARTELDWKPRYASVGEGLAKR
ncbi:NAD-dependent epimerase/dehydratase family protein [Glycomyces rhizosphaerae]|uniref:NAD-dependent epimerase/dehydratase family protein n=1 Tax=Glycomyces rhizosphaerae TaxID=2054422 RepID=A0ABV7Q4S6_9ACTN